MQWKLVVEGDSDRSEAKANANVFIDMLRAEGHTVRQAIFYGDIERPGDEVPGVPVAAPAEVVAEPAPVVEVPEESAV